MIYELRSGTFADSNADGVGDFRRLIKKLDYLAEVLPDFGDGRGRFRLHASAKRAFLLALSFTASVEDRMDLLVPRKRVRDPGLGTCRYRKSIGGWCQKNRCPSIAHPISLCRTSGFPYSSSLR